MTTVRRLVEVDTILFLLVAAAAGMFFAFRNRPVDFHLVAGTPMQEIMPTATPTVSPLPKTQVTSQLSPDGARKLSLETRYTTRNIKAYTVSTSNGDDSNQSVVYTATSAASVRLQIPYNTWSPDDNYFFIEQVGVDNVPHALAFKASGQAFTPEQPFFDTTDMFITREPNYTYTETTGWASPTLLIINSTRANGSKQSFWFEVPSKAIIPLATDF